MSIVRAPRRTRFTTIDQRTINDERLSYRARGILIWVLDKPDNWSVRSESLAEQGKEGREAVRTALQELEDAGYLLRMKSQDEKGLWRSSSYIFERPLTDAQKTDLGFSGAITSTENKDVLDTPPTPPQVGGDRSSGTNPRALGTNPRGPAPPDPVEVSESARRKIRAANDDREWRPSQDELERARAVVPDLLKQIRERNGL